MGLSNIISIAGITIAIFVASILIIKSHKRPCDYLLMAWLLALGLNQAFFLISDSDDSTLPFFVDLLGISMVLIHAPMVFLYVKYAFSKSLHPEAILHAIPWTVFTIGISIYWFINPDSMTFRYGFLVFTQQIPVLISQYGLYLAFVSGGYTLAAYLMILKQKKNLEKTQSNELRNTFNWLERWIMVAIVFFIFTYLVVEISVSTNKIELSDTFSIVNIFISIYIFYVSFYGIRQTQVFKNIESDALSVNEKPLTVLKNDDVNIHQTTQRLRDVIEQNRLYLDSDLSLIELSKISGIPASKVSMAINQGLEINFYDFINEYRVKEFISRLPDPSNSHLSLLGLAYDCGFRSKSTFNSFFKKHTGITPSEFKKSIEK